MSAPLDVIAFVYSDTVLAELAIDTLKHMEKARAIRLVDVAMVDHDPSGNVHIHEVKELTPGRGATRGAMVGGIFGLIFPPTVIASAAVGAAAGALLGKLRDTGMKTTELRQLAEHLTPGQTAVVVLVEEAWSDQLSRMLAGYDRVIRQGLTAQESAILTNGINSTISQVPPQPPVAQP